MSQSSGREVSRENASGKGRQDPLLRQRAMKQASRSGAAPSEWVVESDQHSIAFPPQTIESSQSGQASGSGSRVGGQEQSSGLARKTGGSTIRTATLALKSSSNPSTAINEVRPPVGGSQNALVSRNLAYTSNPPLFFSDIRRRDPIGMGRTQDALTRNAFQHSRSSFPPPITPSPRMRHGLLGGNMASTASQLDGRRRHSMATHMTPSNPDPLPIKSSKPLVPLWQTEDEAFEQRLRSNKRNRAEGGIGYDFIKRISVGANTSRSGGRIVVQRDPDLPKAYLGPGLKLRIINDQDSSDIDDDEPRYRPRAKIMPRKTTRLQAGLKRSAARKIEIKPATSSSEEGSEEDEKEDSSAPSESSSREDGGVNELEIDHLALGAGGENVDMDKQGLAPLPPTITRLDTPPRITVPLPQLGPRTPPEPLIVAIESLSLSCVRMQKTRQLPFLLRNLRRGFERRCLSLGVPTTSDKTPRPPSICVRYEHVSNLSYETWISAWLCPLCELHGEMRTGEMLSSHLKWDHSEVYVEWKEGRKQGSWTIKLLIPEVQDEPKDSNEPLHDHTSARQSTQRNPIPTAPAAQLSQPLIHASPARPRDSLFPYVTLSPPAAPLPAQYTVPASPTPQDLKTPHSERAEGQARQPTFIESNQYRKHSQHKSVQETAATTKQPQGIEVPSGIGAGESDDEMEDAQILPRTARARQTKSQATSPSNIPQRKPFVVEKPPARLDGTTPSLRARSTTGISVTTATTERSVEVPYPSRYPTPPRQDNPLGPAAQPPYLPAKSDYGGPTVYYSCRPGGPSLLDLLDTLPLEPFGVLDWAVLDREDEIFESDDVKDEYKVMHALWARWILLNRNKFVANYHKGAIAFVDAYWKMIHRAAGWDALRYWLLMLLANRFLTGHEVAEVLQHYEGLTGMATWYD